MILSEIDIFKMDKEKVLQRYRRFNKKISTVARTLQYCFAFVFFYWSISRSSAYFPMTVQLFRFLLRRSCSLLVNHHFGFLLGNLIIITLFVKSRHSVSKNNRVLSTVPGDDGDGFRIFREIAIPEAVSDKKTDVPSPAESEELVVQRAESEPKRYRRTRSEEFEAVVTEKIQLRRSDTEPLPEMEESTGTRRMKVEDLSNEEFQRKVEAFIERQQRFLREESLLSIAYRNQCSAN